MTPPISATLGAGQTKISDAAQARAKKAATLGLLGASETMKRVLARLDHDEPGVLLADLDPGEADAARARIPALGLDRAGDVDILAS